MKTFFLHGLDSSGQGTKGRYLTNLFPHILAPDFTGSLEKRLQRLETLCQNEEKLILIGSSFGGLMATCFAATHETRVEKLILMAPALNFPGFLVPRKKISAPAFLLIGKRDDVTPPDKVIPLAQQSFGQLEIQQVDEDHLLHKSFTRLDWEKLLDLHSL